MADLSIGQPLIGGPVGPRRDDAQNLQLELQSVVGRGRRKADACHLFRRLNGQSAFTHQLWTQQGYRKDRHVKFGTVYQRVHLQVCRKADGFSSLQEPGSIQMLKQRFSGNPTHLHSRTAQYRSTKCRQHYLSCKTTGEIILAVRHGKNDSSEADCQERPLLHTTI